MSQLNRKCFIASAGMHGLLFLILLVGPAFLMSRDKPEDLPTLEFIPDKLIDEAFYKPVAPPTKPPEPPRQTPPQKTIEPPKPKPKVDPPPEPKRSWEATKPNEIKISTKRRQDTPRQPVQVSVPRRDVASVAKAIRAANATTTIRVPPNQKSYANYAQAVKSIYERNWSPPEETSRDDATVQVQVIINRDGSIHSARIINRSGEASVDASIDATLRRVKTLPPFPDGATESRRTFTIEFNLKARQGRG
jgi:TonB family protein